MPDTFHLPVIDAGWNNAFVHARTVPAHILGWERAMRATLSVEIRLRSIADQGRAADQGVKKQANALIDPDHTHFTTLPVRDDDGPTADDHGPSVDDHVPSGHSQPDDQVLCETT